MATPTASAQLYDPSQILSVLIENAAALHAAAGLEYDPVRGGDVHVADAVTTPTPTASSAHYDPSSILAALIANAEALHSSASAAATPGIGSGAGIEALAGASLSTGMSALEAQSLAVMADPNTPFLSSHLSLGSPHVPAPLPILASTLTLMLGCALALFGAESLRWAISAGESGKDGAGARQGRRWFKGGFGGLFGGIVFFASLTLMFIMAIPGHAKLSGGALYGIVTPVALLGAVLGGRFKWAGRGFLGISSGLNFVLLLVLSFRPSLLPRLIVLTVFILLSLALTLLLPLLGPHLQATPFVSSRVLALLSAFSGAVLLGQGVDLLMNPASGSGPENLGWLDGLAMLVGTREDWMMNKEAGRQGYKGLLAGVWVFGALGTGVQWWRWSKYGDDPAEQWNAYLSTYLSSFPGALPLTHTPSARAGSFAPIAPWWQRLFSKNQSTAPPRYTGGPESPLTEVPEKKHHHHGHGRRTRGHHHEVDTESVWDGDEKRAMSSSDSDSDSDAEGGAAGGKDYPRKKRHHRLRKTSRPAARYDPAALDEADADADEVGTLVGSSQDAEFAAKMDRFGGSYKPATRTSYDADGRRWQMPELAYQGGNPGVGSAMSGSTAVGAQLEAAKKGGIKVEEVSSSSGEEESTDEEEVGGRERGGATGLRPRGEQKSMVRSLSKMFGGQNKGPARYGGHRPTSPGSPSDAVPMTRRALSPPNNSAGLAPAPPARPRRTSRETVVNPPPPAGSTSPVAVPATPSLLNAIQRINRAQTEARDTGADGGSAGAGARASGEGFWADVEARAAALRSRSPVPGAGK